MVITNFDRVWPAKKNSASQANSVDPSIPVGNEGSLPYYRKLTLHEIKVLEINAT